MELITKAFAVCVLSASAALLIKKDNPPGALALSAFAAAAILLSAAGYVSKSMDFFRRVLELTGVSSALISPLLKCSGIAIVTKLGGDICRDAGESAAAGALEFAGGAVSLYCALPLMQSVLRLMSELV
ncbi:MAG: stage III sporulation AC/AD family protein [Oscillospiraceae bacterium]|nr:stage III sporulation AC/AD family protein [Oscillospiraceae bacterium]